MNHKYLIITIVVIFTVIIVTYNCSNKDHFTSNITDDAHILEQAFEHFQPANEIEQQVNQIEQIQMQHDMHLEAIKKQQEIASQQRDSHSTKIDMRHENIISDNIELIEPHFLMHTRIEADQIHNIMPQTKMDYNFNQLFMQENQLSEQFEIHSEQSFNTIHDLSVPGDLNISVTQNS